MLSSVALLAVIGGAWWVWTVMRWVWLRPRAIERCLRKQGLNGPEYRLLHGDMNQMATMARHAAVNSKPMSFSDDFLPTILPFHHHIIQTYGKNSFAWMGPIARINVMDPELIKEVLVNNRVYKKPTPNPLVRFLVSGMTSYEDEKWAKHRKIVAPALTQDKLKHMFSAMYTSCNDILVTEWSKLVSKNGWCELDVQPYIDDFASDVISRNAFGSSYEQGRRIYRLQKEQAVLTRQVLQTVYLPGWRFLPTKTNKRMKQIDNELRSILTKIMEKKERAMISRESDDHEDLLSLLLKSTMKANGDLGMSVDEAIEECKSFYFAGQESSSNLLVTMILYEVLRLYSPATIFTRITYNETKLGDLTVPAGVQFLLPVIFVHHDREIWGEDAKEFNPERFSEGIAKATKNKLAFFPFSWGPRICIGNNFALMEAKLAISTILQHFSFELSPSYTHSPSYVVTLQPRYGAHLILHKI
ncbi:cytochrome P450 [Cynara cardunculus var. scolymus]|uniref:Cytochrome P450 n=1 Tax=Cynara cardunculus var. scolymus TaxID=59895 RepID=A0A103XLW8_CYNCS|nr:cytochrome P450 [Cynara cardunculus var. scolymus]